MTKSAAVTSVKDIIYTKADDPHPRQKLDIYYPAELTAGNPAPIVLFVHGGAWKRGDKGDHYIFGHSHVGEHLARRGYFCAVVSYRLSKSSPIDFFQNSFLISVVVSAAITLLFFLAQFSLSSTSLSFVPITPLATLPQLVRLFGSILMCTIFPIAAPLYLDEPKTASVKYPDNILDIAESLKWIVDNAEKYGGDTNNIYLCGHSAGAQLVSLLAFHKKHIREVGLSLRQIKGLICVSGCFNIPRMYSIPFVSRLFCVPVFGHDPKTHRDASPIFHVTPREHFSSVHHNQFRVLLINAESDFYLHRDANEMKSELEKSGIHVQTEVIIGKNHRSIMFTRDLVSSKVDAFIQSYDGKDVSAQRREHRVKLISTKTGHSVADVLPIHS